MHIVMSLLVGSGLLLSASAAQALQVCREPYHPARRPSAEALARVYPKAAAREHIQGQAVLNCAERKDGRLDKCIVRSEAPAGYGFGGAALRLAPQLRLASPLRTDIDCARGAALHSRVDTTIRFDLAG